LRGDVTVVPEDPRWFAAGSVLWSGDTRFVVAASQPYRDKGLTVRFEGVADRVAAEALRGTELEIDPTEADLGEGEYWPADLIGLAAVAPSGDPLGEVVDVAYGPQDRLVVETPAGHRVEVPFMDGLVGDPADGRIVIDAPAGLFDDQ
jgi:16S rRNA processing protein RimM